MLAIMDTEQAYDQALDFIYAFVDYSLKKASELARADFNLERMRQLMHLLGNPEGQYPAIHVAGTKGKGSTSALAAAALRAAGLRTGLYTSPHLQDFCERIQVDGKAIGHGELVEMVALVRQAVEQVPRLTTFEITTAIGLLYFARRQVDAAVIEVGLGGRLDATNIIMPQAAVITSLSYDHMAVLGDTLEKIAGEKAGIIKPGVPVVSAPQKKEALQVLEQVAAERRSALTLVGREVHFELLDHDLTGQGLRLSVEKGAKSVILRIPLLGAHQVINAATAYAALQASGLKVTDEAITAGFAGVQWPCRFEIVAQEPTIVLDSAHNSDSFEKLCQTLDDYFPGRPVVLIMGVSEDKQLAEMLRTIQPRLRLLIPTRADHPRALVAEKLAAAATTLGIPSEAVEPVEEALKLALAVARNDSSLILAAGSMFATAEVRTAWHKHLARG